MRACVRACVRASVRACVRAGERAWVRGCVGAWVRGCVRAENSLRVRSCTVAVSSAYICVCAWCVYARVCLCA